MSCNCKRKREIEEKYGTNEDNGFWEKIWIFIIRIPFFIILTILSLAIIPIFVLYIIYKVSFTNGGEVVLPKFLGKYLKD